MLGWVEDGYYDQSNVHSDQHLGTHPARLTPAVRLERTHDAVESALGRGPFCVSEFAYQHFNWGLVAAGESISSVGRVCSARVGDMTS